MPDIANITGQSNTSSEPVDKQPTSKDDSNQKNQHIEIKKETAGLIYTAGLFYAYTQCTAPRYHPPPPPPPPRPPRRPRPLPPPLAPDHRALPYRTKRADFITPDQRAIFGPPVKPCEKADRVGPNRL